jgi:integrase
MPKIIGPPTARFYLFDIHADEETYILMFYNYRNGKQRMQVRFSTARKIHPKDWDDKKQRPFDSKRFSEGIYIKAYLNDLAKHSKDIFIEYDGKISTDDFKKQLRIRMGEDAPDEVEETPKPLTFLEFIDEYCKERKEEPHANPSTLKTVVKCANLLKDYAKERKRKVDFPDLDARFFQDFSNWMHQRKNLSPNSTTRIARSVCMFIRRAEARGLHTNRAYIDFKIPPTPVSKIVLSFNELDQLNALDLTLDPRLEKVRDLFLIGAYTGLRYSDFTRIIPEHIQMYKGERIISITAEKTHQLIHIPLHPTLDAVLMKHGYRSPKISNQKMNDYLKELGQLVGFTQEIVINKFKDGKRMEIKVPKWQKLTTHVARRSFATNFYVAYPHLINAIMKITGHTTERMFRQYIVVDALDSAVNFGHAISKDSKQQ